MFKTFQHTQCIMYMIIIIFEIYINIKFYIKMNYLILHYED